ncbi:beta-lactamase [Aureococcus anophagefferens]|nr:beta-lactamase [Aureococcus anophagefferens]
MGSLERPVCVLLALAAGCGTAVQSVVNFSLSQHVLGDELQRKFVAGFVSFAGGACLMVVCNAALAAYRHVQHRRDPLRHRDECRAPRRCWHCCGGLLGSTGMTLLLVANGRVGYALPSVARLTALLLFSAIFDHVGAFGASLRRLTARRGGLLALATAGASVAVTFDGAAAAAVDEKAVLATAGAAALGFAAGSLTPVQASANRLLAERLGAKIRGTLVCRNQIFNPTSMLAVRKPHCWNQNASAGSPQFSPWSSSFMRCRARAAGPAATTAAATTAPSPGPPRGRGRDRRCSAAEVSTAGVGGRWNSFVADGTRRNSWPSRPRKDAPMGFSRRCVPLPGRGGRCRFAVNFMPAVTPAGSSVEKRAPLSSRKSSCCPGFAPRGQMSVMSPSISRRRYRDLPVSHGSPVAARPPLPRRCRTPMGVDDDVVVLVCPEGAGPDQPIFFRDRGEKCKTVVPRNVRPGQRFRVKRSECLLRKKERPRTAQAALRTRRPDGVPELKTTELDAHAKSTQAMMDLMMPRSLRRSARQRAGKCQDEGFWKQQGFRAAGDPDALTAEKKKDYGYGAPKWSPYYRQLEPDKVRSKEAQERSTKALGDQAWWEQYGFKGSMSEEKKRDYGNGVPGWSPYHRSDELKPGEKPGEKTGLPADAFWFQQWGFRTGAVSEEKRRDYGYGVPMWSPYYRSNKPPRSAPSAPSERTGLMGASLSRRGASPVEGAPEAPEATKRPRAASKEEVQFTRVLEHGHNVSAILAFAGYRNVLTLEALCPRARRLIRGARVELDVSNETNLLVAVKAAARAELFEARRSGASGAKTHYKFVFDDCRARASDIVYRDDRALLLSPRARAPALVEGFRGADVDAARSACAIAAKERRRAALLAIGYFEVELGSRDATGIAARESLFHRSAGLSSTEDADLARRRPRDSLAMGGAVRDGETSGEAGKQRVSEAIQSLLTQERVHTLAAGDEIDFAEGGDPDPPGLSPLAWLRGSVVSVDFKTKKAVVRVGEEEKEAFFGQLRLVEAKPCAAIVLLAHALADHQNDVALFGSSSRRS